MSLDFYVEAPVCEHCGKGDGAVSFNITHNLGGMAQEAGIYQCLWRPEELKIATAGDMIPMLERGLELLLSDPVRFQKFNPPNKWGNYDGLVQFVRDVLGACRERPRGKVSVWR